MASTPRQNLLLVPRWSAILLGEILGNDLGNIPAPICLIVQNPNEPDVMFKIKKSTPLRKLMKAYCTHSHLEPSQVSFQIDGDQIDPAANSEQLGLSNGDRIDAAHWYINPLKRRRTLPPVPPFEHSAHSNTKPDP